ncbi:hypothetical protein GCM10027051_03100 [Niabella terrae]
MNSRSRNRTLIFIIVLLLLTNIGVLSYFLFCNKKSEKPKEKSGFVGILKREIGFDETQVAEFQKIRELNWAVAKKNMKQIGKVKERLLELTHHTDTPDSAAQLLADSIGQLQSLVEFNAFKHIQLTRKICKPQQIAAYDSLMSRMVNRSRSSSGSKNK